MTNLHKVEESLPSATAPISLLGFTIGMLCAILWKVHIVANAIPNNQGFYVFHGRSVAAAASWGLLCVPVGVFSSMVMSKLFIKQVPLINKIQSLLIVLLMIEFCIYVLYPLPFFTFGPYAGKPK